MNRLLQPLKALAFPLIAIAALLVFAPIHQAGAQEPPLPQTWPQSYTFTGATPAPWVVNVAGYNHCTWTAETGATFSSTTLTAAVSADSGTTYANISGTTDPGATPAPAQTLTAVGKLTFIVWSHNEFKVTASGGGSSTAIVAALFCNK